MNNNDIREKMVKFNTLPRDSDSEEESDDDTEQKGLFMNPLLVSQTNKKH